jgi:hypothetical protein
MRLRNWMAVVTSVVLLIAAGSIALFMNRSALRAADVVHRADSAAMGVNNATLAGALQQLSAVELEAFIANHSLNLGRNNPDDQRKLTEFSAKSAYFKYGVTLVDLAGAMLNGTLSNAQLPAVTDPGYVPMHKLLFAGQAGYSSVLVVGGITVLQAVAVPVVVGGVAVAVSATTTSP